MLILFNKIAMKDFKYYITGFTAVGIFIYLLQTGEKDMATQLFQSLLLILAFVFGLNTTPASQKNQQETLQDGEIHYDNLK